MKRSIFKPKKRSLTVQEYLRETLIDAKRIQESKRGQQRYSGAQFELALYCFCDFTRLKQEMDSDLVVDFASDMIKEDWGAGFDWLDLSVSHHDQEAIHYFKQKIAEDAIFLKAYHQYKTTIRPDCVLEAYEAKAALQHG
ncbi:hypothetical protein [Legionella jordanis]|nr:hypothetical protein [Legionella jordanis]RMX00611.1 hypothetical protein EAW55_12630 [Legionella jordanis]RMX21431.1 hypothetical protein EAS68_03695 [Legionella jordanis]HAT8714202.1 hypothetical protein [Legionella jordanis]